MHTIYMIKDGAVLVVKGLPEHVHMEAIAICRRHGYRIVGKREYEEKRKDLRTKAEEPCLTS